jgi:hypothetical protein
VQGCENADTALDVRVTALENAPSPSMPSASDVSYDNTTSGLTADDVQEALDEIVAALPSTGATELATGTLASGATSATLSFSDVVIGATTLIDVYVEDGINYTAISTTSNSVTLTFEAQSGAKAIAVRASN